MELFKKTLEDTYQENKSMNHDDYSKLEFIGSDVFDIDTYNGDLDVLFAKKMIEVIKVIMGKTNYEYIKDGSKYINYITMVNMPFLRDKIEWGTSIRGAWINDYKEYEVLGEKIPKGKFVQFLTELIEWSNT